MVHFRNTALPLLTSSPHVLYPFSRAPVSAVQLQTMSPEYITILRTKPTIQIAVVNGYNKVVSYATVVKTNVLVNKRNFVMHQIDNILTTC